MSFGEFGPDAMAQEDEIVEQDKAEAAAEEEPTVEMEVPAEESAA